MIDQNGIYLCCDFLVAVFLLSLFFFFFLLQPTNLPHNDQERQQTIAAHHFSLLIRGETLKFREGPDIVKATAQSNSVNT